MAIISPEESFELIISIDCSVIDDCSECRAPL